MILTGYSRSRTFVKKKQKPPFLIFKVHQMPPDLLVNYTVGYSSRKSLKTVHRRLLLSIESPPDAVSVNYTVGYSSKKSSKAVHRRLLLPRIWG